MSDMKVKKLLVAVPSEDGVLSSRILPAMQNLVVPPMRYGRCYYLSDVGRTETYNIAVEKAREVNAEYILFWEPEVVPYLANALMYLLDTMEEHERVSLCSWVPSCIPNQVRRVFTGDAGFMLARTSAFDEIEQPYFTDNDLELGDKLKAAGVRWYEHGGAVCERVEAA